MAVPEPTHWEDGDWRTKPRLSERDFELDYQRLVGSGCSTAAYRGYSALTDRRYQPQPTEEPPPEWHAQVAEPWWQAMRTRAEQDQLPVSCLLWQDPLLWSVGVKESYAAAELLRPDGSRYGFHRSDSRYSGSSRPTGARGLLPHAAASASAEEAHAGAAGRQLPDGRRRGEKGRTTHPIGG